MAIAIKAAIISKNFNQNLNQMNYTLHNLLAILGDELNFNADVRRLNDLVGCENGTLHILKLGKKTPHEKFNLGDTETAIELAERILNEIAREFDLD